RRAQARVHLEYRAPMIFRLLTFLAWAVLGSTCCNSTGSSGPTRTTLFHRSPDLICSSNGSTKTRCSTVDCMESRACCCCKDSSGTGTIRIAFTEYSPRTSSLHFVQLVALQHAQRGLRRRNRRARQTARPPSTVNRRGHHRKQPFPRRFR